MKQISWQLKALSIINIAHFLNKLQRDFIAVYRNGISEGRSRKM